MAKKTAEGREPTQDPERGITTDSEGRLEGEMVDAERVVTEGEAISEGEVGSIGEAFPETEVEFIGEAPPDTVVEFIGEAPPGTEVEFIGETTPETQAEPTGEATPGVDVETIRKAEQEVEVREAISETDVDSIVKAIQGVDLESIGATIPQKKVKYTAKARPRDEAEPTGEPAPEGDFDVSEQEKAGHPSEVDELSDIISSPAFSYSDVSPWDMGEEETKALTTQDASQESIYEPVELIQPTEPTEPPEDSVVRPIEPSRQRSFPMGARHRFRLSIMGSLTPSDIDDLPLETEEALQQESASQSHALFKLLWKQMSIRSKK